MKSIQIVTFLAWKGGGHTDADASDILELVNQHDAVMVEVNWGTCDGEDDDYWVRVYTLSQDVYDTLIQQLAELHPFPLTTRNKPWGK